MCGLVGAIQFDIGEEEWHKNLLQMSSEIQHRGPDDGGVWCDYKAGIGLAHRRLSILDLSPQGHQPMHSESYRYVIVYNGEIYNYKKIREELQDRNIKWRGYSDTEVILAAFETWGIDKAINKFVGMFAIAIWDKKERLLHLIRDRMGIKPLYYGWIKDAFVFGSELKAIKAHPSFKQEIDRNSLTLLLRHNYIPAPYSIYKDIFKIRPGHRITLIADGKNDREKVSEICYWNIRNIVESGLNDEFVGGEEEAANELEHLINDSVALRMVSDVPIGAFLSGGIDSSMVVASMQSQASHPIKTFTIGFSDKGFNEAEYAKKIAQNLGTDHTELYVTPSEAMSVIPKLPIIFDEPFSDSSQIPTYLVSELAKSQVTVSLSGDGGDELFAGYGRYAATNKLWSKIRWMPEWLRLMTSKALLSTPSKFLDLIPAEMINKLSGYGRPGKSSDKLKKLANILSADQLENLYLLFVSHWKKPSAVVLGGEELPTALTDPSVSAIIKNPISQLMYIDMISYLPDDILVKIDRASMAVSLESRVPLLDHRIVEFAWRLPHSLKVKDGIEKRVLRNVLYKHVPRHLIERPKMGFGVPIHSWLRTDLRDWGESLLDEARLKNEGFFNVEKIRQKWTEHLSGTRDWHYYLWDILMFQAWLESHNG